METLTELFRKRKDAGYKEMRDFVAVRIANYVTEQYIRRKTGKHERREPW